MPAHTSSHRPRKRFGQHFLTDQSIIAKLLEAIAPNAQATHAGTRLIEIGPGLGALTEPLLAQMGQEQLHVVELDRDLAQYLRKRFGEQLVLHEGDALKFDFSTLIPNGALQAKKAAVSVSEQAPTNNSINTPASSPSLRIVGNLPYNISSPLLFHLCNYASQVIDQHFMLQSEVVERMIAAPGSKVYGRLSVMLQYRYSMEKCLDVPPEAFDPPPKVQSAVVRMIPRPPIFSPAQAQAFEAFVRIAFSQRRKMLRNTLGAHYAHIDFDAMHFNLQRRAEEVGVEEYVGVVEKLFMQSEMTV